MYQIRVTDVDGSNPVVLENANDKELTLAINSAGETIQFTIPQTDPKSEYVNPDNPSTPQKMIEWWDTRTNVRKQHGPIQGVDDNPGVYTVKAGAISQFLVDQLKSQNTFYNSLGQIVDELRYVNIAAQPATSTIVQNLQPPTLAYPNYLQASGYGPSDGYGVFGPIDIQEQFYSLSKYSKDFAIDDDDGVQYATGSIEPTNTLYTTNKFWMGMNKADAIIIDLGETQPINKLQLYFPWWGGINKTTNRSFQFELAYANDSTNPVDVGGVPIGEFTTFYTTNGTAHITEPGRPVNIYTGYNEAGTSFDSFPVYTAQDVPYINARYIRVLITDVEAWYMAKWAGEYDTKKSYRFMDIVTIDGDWVGASPIRVSLHSNNVDGSIVYTPKSIDWSMPDNYATITTASGYQVVNVYSAECLGVSGYISAPINDKSLDPQNDCYASLVEIKTLQELVPANKILPLGLQRIDNNNSQILYDMYYDSDDTITTPSGYRKFEPGGFFSKYTVTWTGSPSTYYTTFFPNDCANCYPDGFSFAILDQNNNMLYQSDQTSDSVDIGWDTNPRPVNVQYALMKGSADAYISHADAWYSTTDPFSWGSSYSWSDTPGATATMKFRGQSFRWYTTVPIGKGGGHAKIYLRERDDTSPMGTWGSWAEIYDIPSMPDDLHADPLFEITYESGLLKPETTYDIKIEVVEGFVSIDSFEGYWQGSFVNYNEDSRRVFFNRVDYLHQVYDARYTNGSIFKWDDPDTYATFDFVGDRIMVLGAKGPNFGKMNIQLLLNNGTYQTEATSILTYRDENDDLQDSVIVDLDNGKRAGEIAQLCIFDSNDYSWRYTIDAYDWGRWGLGLGETIGASQLSPEINDGNDSTYAEQNKPLVVSGDTSSWYIVDLLQPLYVDKVRVKTESNIDDEFGTSMIWLESCNDAIYDPLELDLGNYVVTGGTWAGHGGHSMVTADDTWDVMGGPVSARWWRITDLNKSLDVGTDKWRVYTFNLFSEAGELYGELPWGSYRAIIKTDSSNGIYDATDDPIDTAAYPDRCFNC